MKTSFLILASFVGGAALCGAAQFKKPIRVVAGGKPIQLESPGYAAPSWADMDGDGRKDLLVGQFRNGKIQVFKNLGGGFINGFFQHFTEKIFTMKFLKK